MRGSSAIRRSAAQSSCMVVRSWESSDHLTSTGDVATSALQPKTSRTILAISVTISAAMSIDRYVMRLRPFDTRVLFVLIVVLTCPRKSLQVSFPIDPVFKIHILLFPRHPPCGCPLYLCSRFTCRWLFSWRLYACTWYGRLLQGTLGALACI